MKELLVLTMLIVNFNLLLSGQTCPANTYQTTVTFSNFDSGTPPSNTGEVWSENGIEMEVPSGSFNFNTIKNCKSC